MFGICSFGVQWKTVSSIVHKNFKTSRHTYIYIEEKPSDFERWGKWEALSCPRGEGGVGGAGGNLLHLTLFGLTLENLFGVTSEKNFGLP